MLLADEREPPRPDRHGDRPDARRRGRAAARVPVRAAQFTFTRWAGFSPGRYVPGRKVEVEAYGWAFAAGKPLYFHFQKGRATVKAVRAGVG